MAKVIEAIKDDKPKFDDIMATKVYDVINKLEDVAEGKDYVLWEQWKKVIAEFIADEEMEKATNFFNERKIADKLFYHMLGGQPTRFVETDVSRWA